MGKYIYSILLFLVAWNDVIAGTSTSSACYVFPTVVQGSNKDCSQSAMITGFSATSTATASAEYGKLKAYTYSNSESIFSNYSASSSATAHFDDRVKIIDILGSNSFAYVTFNNFIEHKSSRSFSPEAGVYKKGLTAITYNLDYSSPFGSASSQEVEHIYFGSNPVDNSSEISFLSPTSTLKIRLGQEFTINATLLLSSNIFGSGIVEVDASHSAYWGGIASVVDELGNPIVYTVSSTSGTNWAQSFIPTASVPEPSSFLLLICGLIVVILVHAHSLRIRLMRLGAAESVDPTR